MERKEMKQRFAKLPENPDKKILDILCGNEFSDVGKEFDVGKMEQRKLGLDIVPPVTDYEIAAARYRMLFEFLNHSEEITEKGKI